MQSQFLVNLFISSHLDKRSQLAQICVDELTEYDLLQSHVFFFILFSAETNSEVFKSTQIDI